MAGGFNRYAERNNVKIQRPAGNGQVREIPIHWDAIAKQDRLDMNIVILPGDTIVVP